MEKTIDLITTTLKRFNIYGFDVTHQDKISFTINIARRYLIHGVNNKGLLQEIMYDGIKGENFNRDVCTGNYMECINKLFSCILVDYVSDYQEASDSNRH